MSDQVAVDVAEQESLPPELQDFANARGRPAAFLFHSDSLMRWHVGQLDDALDGRKFEELDLVIHSGGGLAHSAYQIVELLRLHTDRLNACVPFWAKSAATLLSIGADKIVLGERAELGPLDVQMYEEKQAGRGERTSALNPFKTLEQLQNFSVDALSSAMGFIVDVYGMSYDDSLRHAVSFVEATTGPLVSRLDPEKLGEYNRELSVAVEYGTRLLNRYSDRDAQGARRLAEHLVFGYPSHEFIIDHRELQDLGLNVELFGETERQAAKCLFRVIPELAESIICLVEPAAVAADDAGQNGAEDATGLDEAVVQASQVKDGGDAGGSQ
jgi:Serine dehydrogenase proteinase